MRSFISLTHIIESPTMSKMQQAKNAWAQASTAKKTGFSCLSCLGCGGIAFAFLLIIGLFGLIISPNGSTEATAENSTVASAGTASSPRTSTSSSPATATAKPSQEEAVPLDQEIDIQAVPASDTKVAPGSQTALDTLNSLEVKGRAPKTGYDRALYGQTWADVDRNGCDTRNDILRRDLTNINVKVGTNGCKVLTGVLNDPYTATIINFVQGKDTSSTVQIDHVVSLSDSWQTGAQQWDAVKREQFANDPLNLLAVDGPSNKQKSDSDAASWLPPNKDYRCTFVSKQIDVKAKYGLWVKETEKDAMVRVLQDCGAVTSREEEPVPVAEEKAAPEPVVEEPAPAEVPAEPVPAEVPAEPAPVAPLFQAPAEPAPAAVSYPNCSAVKAAGAAPIYAGQPGYGSHLDRDGDGIACEK